MTTTNNKAMSMLMLKQSYEMVCAGGKRDYCEIRDTARNGLVVFKGTYRQCVAEAKRLGIWYS